MSKITPKNLSYDTTLPPFLQRMQNAHTNSGLDGRHERAFARPKKARTAEDEEDDLPAFVDEETNESLSKEEYASLVGAAAVEESKPDDAGAGKEGSKEKDSNEGVAGEKAVIENVKSKDQGVGIGASKKRKVGKLIGSEEEGIKTGPRVAESTAKLTALVDGKSKGEPIKPKKKVKKIKLSFGDDEV